MAHTVHKNQVHCHSVVVLCSSGAARMRPKRPWPTPKQTR